MTREHAEHVLRVLHAAQAAFYAGDHHEAALREILTEEVRWHVPGRNAIAGTYEGIAEVWLLPLDPEHFDGIWTDPTEP